MYIQNAHVCAYQEKHTAARWNSNVGENSHMIIAALDNQYPACEPILLGTYTRDDKYALTTPTAHILFITLLS